MKARDPAALAAAAALALGLAGCGVDRGLTAGVPRGVDYSAGHRPAVASHLAFARPSAPKSKVKARAVRRVAARPPTR